MRPSNPRHKFVELEPSCSFRKLYAPLLFVTAFPASLLVLTASVVKGHPVQAPGSALDYLNRGTAQMDKDDIDGAIAAFTKAIELDPQLANAYFQRGRSRGNKGDLEGALADLVRPLRSTLGRTYFLSEAIKYKAEVANLFGGEPFPGQAQFTLKAIDQKSGRALIAWRQELAEEKARPIMEKTVKELERFG